MWKYIWNKLYVFMIISFVHNFLFLCCIVHSLQGRYVFRLQTNHTMCKHWISFYTYSVYTRVYFSFIVLFSSSQLNTNISEVLLVLLTGLPFTVYESFLNISFSALVVPFSFGFFSSYFLRLLSFFRSVSEKI